eukprot:CAMPEP_0194399990 /NCGR_PEP_ID=MMETSP0174-20130528/126965_1 /TAXON_ID=216777 /ORGANISM="Proboscia alata, Strain PI-D3" /LENGTH=407 /DNA_ID=CAMNT_0039196457 /DNA_START=156 /DNA_END=1379 /DNA_ORIENTATION=+
MCNAQIGDQCACMASSTTFKIRDLTQSCPNNKGGPGLPSLDDRGIKDFDCDESVADDTTAVSITYVTVREKNALGNTIRTQKYEGPFIVGDTFEFDSITNQLDEYPIGSVNNLPAMLQVEALALNGGVNQTVLFQNWTLKLLINDTSNTPPVDSCTVEPFVAGDFVGWISFQKLDTNTPPVDSCTVEPFVAGDFVGWISFQKLDKPKRYLCPAFGNDIFPIAGLTECRWDGFKNGGQTCSDYDNRLGLGGDCLFDAQANKKRGVNMNCQETSAKECNLEIVKQFRGCYRSCKRFHRKCCCPAKVLAPTHTPTKSPSPSTIPPTDGPTMTCPYLDFKRSSSCKSYNAVLNGDCLFNARDGKLATTCAIASRKGCDVERIKGVSNCYSTCRMFHERCCCPAYDKLDLGS